MFDWTPQKKTTTVTKQKEANPSDLDELFSSENDIKTPSAIPKKDETISKTIKDSSVLTSGIKNENQNKTYEQKEEIKNLHTEEDDDFSVSIGEVIQQQPRKNTNEPNIYKFSIDDEKISPTGAASSQQDGVKTEEKSSENWRVKDVLKFLNSLDVNEVFSSPSSVLKQETKVPKFSAKAPKIPEKAKNDTGNISQNAEKNHEDELIKKLINSRYPFHSGKDNFDKELNASSSPYINAFSETKNEPPTMIVDDFGDRSLWELQLNNSNLPGMELEEFTLLNFDHIHLNEMRRSFHRARRDFIKFVSYNNQQDLYAAGLDDIDISMLRKGYACENFNVHRKVPYEYGGNNDFSNFCLIQTHPYHDNLHKFLDMQIFIHPKGAKVKRLFIPIPNGNVYVPYLDITGSGGKSKHDRSVYAGFHEETFNLIAQKTAMGKAAEL